MVKWRNCFILVVMLFVISAVGCSSNGMERLTEPKQIILSSETKTETLNREDSDYEAWYKACLSSWNNNLVQGDVVFVSYLHINEEDVDISPLKITFVYDEGAGWSQEGRPLEMDGLVYTFFPIGAELAAITDNGNYTEEAFVLPFVPTQALRDMASEWLGK